MKFRTPYNVDEFEKPVLRCETPSLTQQQFKDDADINNIVARYANTGVLGNPNDIREGRYIDVSNMPDYQEALNTVNQADEAFMSLPATVRKRFNNNPAEMLAFVNNVDNYEEALKLGLVNPRVPLAIQSEEDLEPSK